MKYVITENRLEAFMISEFDKDLTPTGGWWSHSKIKKYLRGFSESMPIYYDKDFYTDWSDNDSDEFMSYLKKYKIVALQHSIYNKYDLMFGDFWEPVFIRWFEEHSGLPVKEVRNLSKEKY